MKKLIAFFVALCFTLTAGMVNAQPSAQTGAHSTKHAKHSKHAKHEKASTGHKKAGKKSTHKKSGKKHHA